MSAVMITVGSVIGSGIFLKPLAIASVMPSALSIYLLWALVGFACLCGAFAYGELTSMMPEAGGQYAFMREAWGPFFSFLFGWTYFWVINAGSAAALAVGFAGTLGDAWHWSPSTQIGVAVAMIAFLAGLNHVGVAFGAWFQNVSTVAKIICLVAIAVGGIFAPDSPVPVTATAAPELSGRGIAASCMAMFWAFEGWHQLSFSAAELKNPSRDLPRGLVWGTMILIFLYLVVNAAYIAAVPLAEMRTMTGASMVPITMLDRVFGRTASSSFALLLGLSIFGATNTNFLSAPRAFYAMAKDGRAPSMLGHVDPRFRTPSVAIWSQAVLAIGIVFWLQKFADITDYVVFASLLFYAMTVSGVYILRRRRPGAPRSYRCTGYPFTPAVFVAVALFADFWTLSDPEKRDNALYGLAIIAAGAIVYAVLFRRPNGRVSANS